MLIDTSTAAETLRAFGKVFGSRGWLPATSGNLSIKVSDDPVQMAITRSGVDKENLVTDDILVVDADLRIMQSASPSYKSSAETIVHAKLYQAFQCGCILHTHTLYNNLASQVYFRQGYVLLRDHELLKALEHWEEGASIHVPIVENFHDIPKLADAVVEAAKSDVPGVLVRNHGIYVWGKTPFAARRYLDAFEFLFHYDFLVRQHGGV